MRNARFPNLFVLLTLGSTIVCAQPSFQGLGGLTAGAQSCAHAVSADGMVVVGYSSDASGDEAFRWTAAGGMQGLGDLPGGSFSSSAESVSGNGSVIVGYSSVTQSNSHAFRWTATQGMVDINVPVYGTNTFASGVSDDGSLIVGAAGTNSWTGFRWGATTGPFSLLVEFPPKANADGSVIGGCSGGKPARWLVAPNGQMTSEVLSSTIGGFNDISPDGNVATGNTFDRKAFRWRASDGVLNIHDPKGLWTQSQAWGVSADGSVVVGEGTMQSAAGGAFIWDAAHGMRRLQDVLQNDFGLELSGWTLHAATGISDDGMTIVGCGTHQMRGGEAWIARVPRQSVPAVPAMSTTGLVVLFTLAAIIAPVVFSRRIQAVSPR